MAKNLETRVTILESKFRKAGIGVRIVNIGVGSVDTTNRNTIQYKSNGQIYFVDVNGVSLLISGSGSGSQNLAQVLTEGNIANNQIKLKGNIAKMIVEDTTGANSITLDPDKISIQNTSGFAAVIKSTSHASNLAIELPLSSGRLALLSDIPIGGPVNINIQPGSSYTVQASDLNSNTMIVMTSNSANTIVLDSAIASSVGYNFMVNSKGLGKTSFVAAGTTVILTPNGVTPELTFQNSTGFFLKETSTEWVLSGDIGSPIITAPDLQAVLDEGNIATNKSIGLLGDGAGFYSQSEDGLDQAGIGVDGTTASLSLEDRNGNKFAYSIGGSGTPYGLTEITSLETGRNILTLFGKNTSNEIFSIRDFDNPGTSKYLSVRPDGGTMAGDWVITRSGSLNIATAVAAPVDMLKLTNVNTGSHTIKFNLDDNGLFKIKHNSTDYLTFGLDGGIAQGNNIAGNNSLATGVGGQLLAEAQFGAGESYTLDAGCEASSAIAGFGCEMTNCTDSAIGGTAANMGDSSGSFVYGVGTQCYSSLNSIALGAAQIDGATGGDGSGSNAAIAGGNVTGSNSVAIGFGSTTVGNKIIAIGSVTGTLSNVVHVPNLFIDPTQIGIYTNNAAAITAGLVAGQVYYTNVAGDGILKIVI